jgi:hypothetical protein
MNEKLYLLHKIINLRFSPKSKQIMELSRFQLLERDKASTMFLIFSLPIIKLEINIWIN